MEPNVRRAWEDFLNPEIMRERLIAASVYITAFELLKAAILEPLRDFFSLGHGTSSDGISENYREKVLSLHRSPQYASLRWLRENKVIDSDDEAAFETCKALRNRLTHELVSVLGTGLPSEFEASFGKMLLLVRKIEVWWIVNVEIPTDPDLAAADLDESEIVPGRVLTLELLRAVALGDADQSKYYYEQFKQMTGGV